MKREKSKKHWHIDYLTSELCEVTAVLVLNRGEKEIVNYMFKRGYHHVKGFGSSDDNTFPSHLFKIDMISLLSSISSLLKW